jgi:hypothetical protein
MEHQLWKSIVAVLRTLDKPRVSPRYDFSDQAIVEVFYWSVVCDRPTSWACRRENWPVHLRGRPLPSPATMSRRLRSRAVVALLDALERRVTAPKEPGVFWMIDGKPLTVGGCSKDRQAGYGKAAGAMAKGYKLHALTAPDGGLAVWRLAPMNTDERAMAERLVRAAPSVLAGYLLADANYDSNRLHRVCQVRGALQLVTPRRRGPGQAAAGERPKGTGHRRQSAGRLRSIALAESPFPDFGEQLRRDRAAIERQFGGLVNWGGGLTCLPAWVRTHRRVRRWVQAKLALTALKRQAGLTTCAA